MMKNLSNYLWLTIAFIAACQQNHQSKGGSNIDQSARMVSKPDNADGNSVKIAFYNQENLFDTIDQPDVQDEDFLPNSFKQWDGKKLQLKLDNMARVIDSLSPAILGMCEVENEGVLKMLVHHPTLKAFQYQVLHVESPDPRGIDNAIIYKRTIFNPEGFEGIKVVGVPHTRSIFHVEGKLLGRYKIHVFVNHWPSRRGGQEESEPKRILAAETLKKAIDNVKDADKNAIIIAMGDFNDEPTNISVSQTLGAKCTNAELINLMACWPHGEGTHKYKGEWHPLDQIIVSRNLYDGLNGISIIENKSHKYMPGWMLEKDPFADGLTPRRTYGGQRFLGGYSDHLPVYIELMAK